MSNMSYHIVTTNWPAQFWQTILTLVGTTDSVHGTTNPHPLCPDAGFESSGRAGLGERPLPTRAKHDYHFL